MSISQRYIGVQFLRMIKYTLDVRIAIRTSTKPGVIEVKSPMTASPKKYSVYCAASSPLGSEISRVKSFKVNNQDFYALINLRSASKIDGTASLAKNSSFSVKLFGKRNAL